MASFCFLSQSCKTLYAAILRGHAGLFLYRFTVCCLPRDTAVVNRPPLEQHAPHEKQTLPASLLLCQLRAPTPLKASFPNVKPRKKWSGVNCPLFTNERRLHLSMIPVEWTEEVSYIKCEAITPALIRLNDSLIGPQSEVIILQTALIPCRCCPNWPLLCG